MKKNCKSDKHIVGVSPSSGELCCDVCGTKLTHLEAKKILEGIFTNPRITNFVMETILLTSALSLAKTESERKRIRNSMEELQSTFLHDKFDGR